jgi:hypothetical protein
MIDIPEGSAKSRKKGGPEPKFIKLKVKPCINCGEDIDLKTKGDLCPICKEELRTKDMPEPTDFGDQTCWFDGSEHKIHHCINRIKTATEHHKHGRAVTMPQCLRCGDTKETTPLPPQKEYTEVELIKCTVCGKEFHRRAKSQQQRICRECLLERQRLSNVACVERRDKLLKAKAKYKATSKTKAKPTIPSTQNQSPPDTQPKSFITELLEHAISRTHDPTSTLPTSQEPPTIPTPE